MNYKVENCVNCGLVENTSDFECCPVCGERFGSSGFDVSALTSKVADVLELKIKEFEVKVNPQPVKSCNKLWLIGTIVAFITGHPWISLWSFMNYKRGC